MVCPKRVEDASSMTPDSIRRDNCMGIRTVFWTQNYVCYRTSNSYISPLPVRCSCCCPDRNRPCSRTVQGMAVSGTRVCGWLSVLLPLQQDPSIVQSILGTVKIGGAWRRSFIKSIEVLSIPGDPDIGRAAVIGRGPNDRCGRDQGGKIGSIDLRVVAPPICPRYTVKTRS